VQIFRRMDRPMPLSSVGLVVLGILVLGMASCQSPHRPTRRMDPDLTEGWPRGDNFFHQVTLTSLQVPAPEVKGAERVNDDQLCETCHPAYYKAFQENVHRNSSCEDCHGPASKHLEARGKEPGTILSFKKLPPAERSELCLKCHEQNACDPGARWRTSVHAHNCVSCTDCHRAHYNVPPGTPATTEPGQTTMADASATARQVSYAGEAQQPKQQQLPSLRGTSNHLGAVAPNICYKCHTDYQEFQQVAGPHQICGPNGFNCTTCHDPHGKILEGTRVELCLQCHSQHAPVMAWDSTIHRLNGVACTDCHNPHPRTCVPQFVDIRHTDIRRPPRRMMSVFEPDTCYKCHPKIYGLNALPSHHPIKEGKMVCSDCHDPHGQTERNLKEATVNLVCYRCHAEKQGPFVFQHPPVEENCAICHEPHGSVTNNLLRQPAMFLCLRCHSGHRGTHGAGQRNDIDDKPWVQQAFYSNSCNLCHVQIHGSDLQPGNGAPFSR